MLCVAADIILFKLVLSSSERDFLAAQLEVLTMQGQRELEYYDSVNEKIQEIRRIRHDFNNQLQAAYGVVQMGTEQGRETAAALLPLARRVTEKHAYLPVVFITGYAEQYYEDVFLSVRPAGFLSKPVKKELLFELIRRFAKFPLEEKNYCIITICDLYIGIR